MWNLVQGTVEETHQFAEDIRRIESFNHSLYVLSTSSYSDSMQVTSLNEYKIHRIKLAGNGTFSHKMVLYSEKIVRDFFIAPGSSASAIRLALLKESTVWIYELSEDAILGHYEAVVPERAVCFAFHPTQDVYAVGGESGKIYFFHQRQHYSQLHWHAKRVNCLTFSQDGSLLLSGGPEGVIVIWQLYSSMKKRFIAHLSASIQRIIYTDALIVTCMQDGTQRIFRNQSSVITEHFAVKSIVNSSCFVK